MLGKGPAGQGTGRAGVDQVTRQLSKAVSKQTSLAVAEEALTVVRRTLEVAEKDVRVARHAVEKLTLQLAKATSLTSPQRNPQLTIDAKAVE